MTKTGLIFLNAWRLRGRYAVLLVVLVLGSGLVAAGTTLGAYANDGVRSGVDEATALRRISVYGDSGGGPLNADRLTVIRGLPGVQVAEPVVQSAVGLNASRALITLTNTRSTSKPPLVSGRFPRAGSREIVLPASVDGIDQTKLVGTVQSVSYTTGVTQTSGVQKTMKLPVVGVYDASWQVDGPAAGYCDLSLVRWLAASRAGVPPDKFAELVGFDRVEVLAATAEDVAPLTDRLQADGFHAVSVQQELDQVPGVISLIRLITQVLFGVLLLLAVITAIGMSQALARQRRREAAVLRTLGWPSSGILRVLLGEVTLIALVACVCGAGLGVAAALVAAGQLRTRPMFADALAGSGAPPLLLAVGIVIAVAVVAAGAAQPLARVARADVVDTLRQV